MIILELFAGTRSISKTFEEKGHKTYSVEWDKTFKDITLYEDINNLTKAKVLDLLGGGKTRRNMGFTRLYNLFSSWNIQTQEI